MVWWVDQIWVCKWNDEISAFLIPETCVSGIYCAISQFSVEFSQFMRTNYQNTVCFEQKNVSIPFLYINRMHSYRTWYSVCEMVYMCSYRYKVSLLNEVVQSGSHIHVFHPNFILFKVVNSRYSIANRMRFSSKVYPLSIADQDIKCQILNRRNKPRSFLRNVSNKNNL